MTNDPAFDPIEAFLWIYSKTLREHDPDGRLMKSEAMAKKIYVALSTDEVKYFAEACRQAIMDDQKRLMGTDRKDD
jgi:hypothetical protein